MRHSFLNFSVDLKPKHDRDACHFYADCAVCSDGYTAQLGYTCDKCSDSTGGIVVVAVLALVALSVCIAVVMYVMSGEAGCTGRRGPLGRLFRNIPLQSVKIVIVAWQIITQVRLRSRQHLVT